MTVLQVLSTKKVLEILICVSEYKRKMQLSCSNILWNWKTAIKKWGGPLQEITDSACPRYLAITTERSRTYTVGCW